LKETLRIHSNDSQILQALVSFGRLAGDAKAAIGYAEQIAIAEPGDHDLAEPIRASANHQVTIAMTASGPTCDIGPPSGLYSRLGAKRLK
jgi:hypothetical protein